MGSIAQPFAVDLESVRKVLGSNDLAFIEKVKSTKRYDNYASQAEDCDFDDVLDDLIVGYIKPENRKPMDGLQGIFKGKTASGLRRKLASEYGYALLVICDALGTYLSPQGDIFYAGKVWKEVNGLCKRNGIKIDLDRMWENQKLFDIPPISDFPVISHYTKEEVGYLLTELTKINVEKNDSQENRSLHQLLNAFKDGLQICKDKNVEWVSFLH